jgi:hypothetical protein
MVQSRTSISAIGPRRERLAAHDSPKHLEIFSLGASRRPSGRSTIHPSCAGPPVAQGERTPASRRKACDLSHAERAGNPDHAVARVALLVLAASSGPRSNMAALPIVSSFSVRRPAHHRVYSTPGGCHRRMGRPGSQNQVPACEPCSEGTLYRNTGWQIVVSCSRSRPERRRQTQ